MSNRFAVALATFAVVSIASAQTADGGKVQPANAATAAPAPGPGAKQPVTPPPFVPYKIRLYMQYQPPERFSAELRRALELELLSHADRHLGAAWQLTIEAMPTAVSILRPPTPVEMKAQRQGFDKVILVRLGDNLTEWKGGLADVPAAAREFDFEFESWGPAARETLADARRMSHSLFQLVHRQFRVRAEVGAAMPDGKVPVTLFGLALQPRNSDYPLAEPGTPIRVYRDFLSRDKKKTRTEIPWTFLIYRQPEAGGLLARCDVMSALRNPLTMRTRRRVQMPAIGAGATELTATDLRFVAGPDAVPVTGYEIAIRAQDSKATVNLGNTDHRGRITVDRSVLGAFGGPTDAVRTVQVLLVAGQTVIASFPMVPGEKDFRQISVRIDPLVAEVNGRVMALQDSVVDTVARRAILQRRLDLYQKKNNIDMAKKVAKDINSLPDRASYEKKIADIRTWAEARAKAAKRPLGSPVNKLLLQTEKNVIANNFDKEKVEVTEQITVEKKVRGGDEETKPEAAKPK